MRRFVLLLMNEFRFFRTTIPIHVVAILQPTVMYLLMADILVHPTFDMYVVQPSSAEGQALVAAMRQVGSPIGSPYINPILVDESQAQGLRQVVIVEERDGLPTAVQRYGLVDSNIVKNFRNRLTAAALILWNNELDSEFRGFTEYGEDDGSQGIRTGVKVEERPWLPRDMPYTLYFGMAILPMTAAIAASVVGGMLTAQEFEYKTIQEYRLSPVHPGLILGARLARLVLTSLISAGILLVAIRLEAGAWPSSPLQVILVLLPVAIIAAGIGVMAGLVIQRIIPTFLVGLVTSFVGWILGSAFGLAAHFSGPYEFFSRLTPNTHAVELLFPLYFGVQVGNPLLSALVLGGMSLLMLAVVTAAYYWRVQRSE